MSFREGEIEKVNMHFRELTYFFKVFSLHSEGRLFGFLLLSFLVALLESLSLLVLLPVLELVNIGGNEKFESPRVVEKIKDFFNYFDFSLTLWSATLLLFFIIMAKNVLVFIASCWKAWMKTQMSVKIKNNLIRDLNKVSHRHFQKKSSGFYVSLATVQIDRFLKSFMQFCSILVTAISLVLYVSLSFLVEWKLATAACLFGLLSLVLFSKIGVFVRQKAAVFSDTSNLFSSTVIQIIQSFKYSVSTNTTGKLELGLSRVISKLEKASFKIGVANSLAKSIQEPLALVGIVGALFLMLVFFEQTLASAIVSILLFYRTLNGLLKLQVSYQSFLGYSAVIDLIGKEFEGLKSNREKNGNRKISKLKKELTLKDVSFAFTEGRKEVVSNVSMTFPKGRLTLITGPSGSGKTTLLDMMSLLNRPQNGKILIDGKELAGIKLESWRSQIGYVSQDVELFDDTIANNVCMWDGDASSDTKLRKRIENALSDAGLDDLVSSLPEGLETQIGDRGALLSGGQRQRLALARELFRKPKFLILDEATSALDKETESLVHKRLVELKPEIAIAYVSHNKHALSIADYVYVLRKGQVIFAGKPAELSRQNYLPNYEN